MVVHFVGDSLKMESWQVHRTSPWGQLEIKQGWLGAALVANEMGYEVSNTEHLPQLVTMEESNITALRDHDSIMDWPTNVEAKSDDTVVLFDLGLTSRETLPVSEATMFASLHHQHLGLLTQVANKEQVIPVVTMDDLRQRGAAISQRISWESTAVDFVRDLALGISQQYLSPFPTFYVFIGQEGMIAKRDETLTLYFTPDQIEHDMPSLSTPGLRESLLAKVIKAHGEDDFDMTRVLPTAIGQQVLPAWEDIEQSQMWSILDTVCEHIGTDTLETAKQLVIYGEQTLLRQVPSCTFGALQAVDRQEIENYRAIVNLINDYRVNGDTRPLSIAVFGFPGSGKSFGIKQIARTLGGFKTYTFNISQFTSLRELEVAFQEIRDASIQGDGLPLVFFDEFDSSFNDERLGWLKYFLAPMQDGTFMENGVERPIGRAIFVFAGGTSVSFDQFIAQEETAFKAVKGPDFISRLKGYLNIQGPNPVREGEQSYLIRRAMLLRSMISRGAKQLLDEHGHIRIDDTILHALLTTSTYKHGARSIEFFISMSPIGQTNAWHAALLPPKTQMNIHVDAEEFVMQMSILTLSNKLAMLSHNMYVETYLQANPEASMGSTDTLVPWSQLSSTYQESNVAQIRFHLDRFKQSSIGIRHSITPGYTFRFHEEDIEILAQAEHDRWMNERLKNGWIYAKLRDNQQKHHPALIPWEQLSEDEKQKDRDVILKTPILLKEVGFELFYKTRQ